MEGVQAELAAQVAGAEDAVVGDKGQRVDLACGRAREDQLHRQRLLTVAHLQLGHLFQARPHVLRLEALVGVNVEIDARAEPIAQASQPLQVRAPVQPYLHLEYAHALRHDALGLRQAGVDLAQAQNVAHAHLRAAGANLLVQVAPAADGQRVVQRHIERAAGGLVVFDRLQTCVELWQGRVVQHLAQ